MILPLEENGHYFRYPEITGDRCTHCMRRIEHYRSFLRASREQPERFDLAVDTVCDSIIDRNPQNSDTIEPVGWGTHFHGFPPVHTSFDEITTLVWYQKVGDTVVIPYPVPPFQSKIPVKCLRVENAGSFTQHILSIAPEPEMPKETHQRVPEGEL